MDKQLYRSRVNKVIVGVCGGIAEYFNIDPVIVRIIWIALGAFGAGIFIYIIAALLIPEKPNIEFVEEHFNVSDDKKIDAKRNKFVIGGSLILIGIVFALKEIFQWFGLNIFWPLIIIIAGIAIIYRNRRENNEK